MKSKLYQNLFSDKIVIIVNSMPAISNLLSLGAQEVNPITFFKIQVQSGKINDQAKRLTLRNVGNEKRSNNGLIVWGVVEATDLIKHRPTQQ